MRYSSTMKKLLAALLPCLLLFINSCQKCYTCKQYCAYCETVTGVRMKYFATKDVNRAQVDSVFQAWKAAGYTCTLLNESRNVCDNPNKINEATNYFYKQDYYCYPKE